MEVSMSKASGILLIVVGIGVAIYAMPSGVDEIGQATQETVAAKQVPGEIKTVRTEEIVPPIPKLAVRPVKGEVKADAKTASNASSKTTVVSIAQHVSDPADHARAAQKTATVLPGDRVGLTRELQRELKRVGCYDGEINGMWTPVARRGMKAFTDRLNATLPVDQPAYILLTMVQGRQERACGAPCPTGQAFSDDGRCLPQAVIARAAKKPATNTEATGNLRKTETTERPNAAVAGWATTTTVATTALPNVAEGRMALAGPKKESAAVRVVPGADASRLAAIGGGSDLQAKKPAEVQREHRRAAKRAVQNRSERYVSAPRRKFGPWFFRQQDTWNN
jgi:hypothetical protein